MEKIKTKEKLSYGIGALGKDFYAGLFGTYLMIYLTDVFGISALVAGTLILVARVWDAVNDPLMGVIVDKTNTRWGKFRPYLFFIPLIMGAAMIGLFTVPDISYTGKVIWAYFFYILAGMCFTAYDVPIMSMAPAISNNTYERTSLLTFSRFFTYIGAMAVAIITVPVVAALGDGNDATGYQRYVVILVLFAILASWIAFFNTKERTVVMGEKIKFKDYKNLLAQNKPLLILILAVVLSSSANSIGGNVALYFFTYALGRPELVPVFMGTAALVIFAFPFVPALTKKFGRIKITKAVALYQSLIGLVSFIIYSTVGINIAYVLFVSVTTVMCSALPIVTVISMIADTVDYGHYKTGIRSEGLTFSLNSFALKVGMALASGVVGFTLAITGYVANADQSTMALTGIIALMSLVPALFSFLFYLTIRQYTLTEEKVNEFRSEMESR